jgi:LacI family transcriptional regulator
VRVDNVAGAREGVAHLLAAGCRRIGLISGIARGEGLDLNPTVAERRKGYSLALKAAGLATRPELLAESGFYDKADGRRSLDQLLAAEPRLDAVFCAAGDNVALGVLERAQELGLSVPGRLKVLGFDDIEAAALVRPALSTLRQPIQALGAQAFDLAVAAVDGRLSKPSEIVFKPTMVLRKSA